MASPDSSRSTPRIDSAKLESLLSAFTAACLAAFGPERVTGVIAHGSAVKGGAIPGYSDADFMVFLTPDCFDENATLLEGLAFAIQPRIGGLAWPDAGFGYGQAYFYDPARMPVWWTGPAPGAYRVLQGRLPQGLEATAERLRAASERLLRGLSASLASELRNFADSADDQMRRRLRLIGTSVTPAIFALATLDSCDVLALWVKTKFEALAELEELYPNEPGPALAAQLYARLGPLFSAPSFDVASGLEAFRLALRFLRWVEATAAPRLGAAKGEGADG